MTVADQLALRDTEWLARLTSISRAIHEQPELRFEERSAMQLLSTTLRSAGFTVQQGYGGLETAFRADHVGAQGGPTVAILLEYDALPGIGHGCGHNLIAALGVSAAIAVLQRSPEHAGILSVIGTPGEEGGGGKIRMLEAGAFDGVDAAMMAHPADRTLLERHGLAAHHLRFSFSGTAAHAAKSPEAGRSALAAAYLFLNAIDAMRQFMPTTARVHGIVEHGGDAPNVVPDRSSVLLFVRDRTDGAAAELRARVERAAAGVAMATGTDVDIAETAPTYGARVNSSAMAGLFGEALEGTGLVPDAVSESNPAGSSDIGNLSTVLPIIHPYFQIADRGVSSHSRQFAEEAISDRAHEAAAIAAKAIAHTAESLLEDPRLMARVRAEFELAVKANGVRHD